MKNIAFDRLSFSVFLCHRPSLRGVGEEPDHRTARKAGHL